MCCNLSNHLLSMKLFRICVYCSIAKDSEETLAICSYQLSCVPLSWFWKKAIYLHQGQRNNCQKCWYFSCLESFWTHIYYWKVLSIFFPLWNHKTILLELVENAILGEKDSKLTSIWSKNPAMHLLHLLVPTSFYSTIWFGKNDTALSFKKEKVLTLWDLFKFSTEQPKGAQTRNDQDCSSPTADASIIFFWSKYYFFSNQTLTSTYLVCRLNQGARPLGVRPQNSQENGKTFAALTSHLWNRPT